MIFNKTNFRIASMVEMDHYYLDGVHVTPEYTEVTNGHYLIRVEVPFKKRERNNAIKELPQPDGYEHVKKECEFVMPANAAKEIEKNIPKKPFMPILNNAWVVKNEENNITILTTDLETTKPVTFHKIDSKFPNSDNVIEKTNKEPAVTIGFNANYMMQICQQYKKAGIKCVELSLFGLTEAMKIEGTDFENDQKITTILMPMQIGDGKDKWHLKQEEK